MSNLKASEFFSEQVTTDVNLTLTIEEEEVTELTLRKKKKKAQSKVFEVINSVERKNTKASGYIVQASQVDKEYFDKIKRLGIYSRKLCLKEKCLQSNNFTDYKGSDRIGRGSR